MDFRPFFPKPEGGLLQSSMVLLESTGGMIARHCLRGRKCLIAIAVTTMFILNLSSAWAAGGGNTWHDFAPATTPRSSLISIGDRVWHDENGQGDQNENCVGSACLPEPGLNGVEIYLYKDNGDGAFDRYMDTLPDWTVTRPGISQDPDGWLDGIYQFEIGQGEYWVWVDENTLPPNPPYGWNLTTGSNPQKITYAGDDDFSIDFGFEPVASPAPPVWRCWLPLVHR